MTHAGDVTSTERKVALLIGNKHYSRRENLVHHAIKNVKDLQQVLSNLGFQCTVHLDIDRDIMDKISDFEETIRQDDLVVFYYSGHCRHANGQNYLVPVDDTRIDSDGNFPDFGVDLSRVTDRLCSKNINNISLYMLDCYKPYLLKDESPSEGNLY